MNRLTLILIIILLFFVGWFAWIAITNKERVVELSSYQDLYTKEQQISQKLKDDVAYWKSRAEVAEGSIKELEGLKILPAEISSIKRSLRSISKHQQKSDSLSR